MENEIHYNNTSIHLPLCVFFFITIHAIFYIYLNILHEKFCEEIKKLI